MNLKEIVCKGMKWIHVAQDMVQWRAVLNIVINLLVL